MSFDEDELRRALDGRSAAPSPDLRSRLRQAVTRPRQTAGSQWLPAIAIIVVTVLTATSVGVLVVGRHARGVATASGSRTASPLPPAVAPASSVQLSAPFKGVAWALVDYRALYTSTDGGDHWQRRALPDNLGVKPSIAFINDSEGWLLAPGSPTSQCEQASAAVWHTTDGAATWFPLKATGILDAQCKDGIYFVDADHGFVTAWDDNHRPTVYVTVNEGMSWRKSTLPDNPIFTTAAGGFTLRVGWIKGFRSDIYLEASGAQHDPKYPHDFIYTSTDGGATWTWKQKLASPYTYMVSELRWLQLAPDTMESVNGGQVFSPFATDLKVTPPVRASFVNDVVGYVVAGSVIQRTTDGGAHWKPLSVPWAASVTPSPSAAGSAVELSAPTSNAAWALVDYDALFRSTDRGATWTKRSLPSNFGLRPSISFINASEGWLLVPGSPTSQCGQASGAVWHTTDAAATWQKLPATGIAQSQCKSYIWFADSRHGFIGAWDDLHPATIYRTSDGGQTWAASKLLPDPPNYQSQEGGVGYQVTWLKSFGSTYYLGALGTPYIYRSSDGGTSWKWFTKVPSTAVVMVTETRWLDFTDSGQALESTNGGQAFGPFVTDLKATPPVRASFVNDALGYVVAGSVVQRTTDGGAHWTVLSTPWTASVTPSPGSIPMPTTVNLSAPSSSVVWALVAGQHLFRSTDQGNSWQPRNMPQFTGGGTAAPLITFADDQDGWVFFVESSDCTSQLASPTRRQVQQGVQVYRTNDGARTWTVVDTAVNGQVSARGLPLDQCKTAFDFSDPQHGLVTATDQLGSMYAWRTSDGGATWTSTRLPAPPGWKNGDAWPWFIKSWGDTVLLYGFYFWLSTDRGATWTTYATGFPTPLTIVTPVRWLVIFPAASTLETLDAGKTWHDFPDDYHFECSCGGFFVFPTDRVGYGTDSGRISRTLDGGSHWELIKTSWP
jgi:photosystem II stability/assembly factor-like uncharacterized protein